MLQLEFRKIKEATRIVTNFGQTSCSCDCHCCAIFFHFVWWSSLCSVVFLIPWKFFCSLHLTEVFESWDPSDALEVVGRPWLVLEDVATKMCLDFFYAPYHEFLSFMKTSSMGRPTTLLQASTFLLHLPTKLPVCFISIFSHSIKPRIWIFPVLPGHQLSCLR